MAVVDNALRAVGEEITERQLAALKLELLRREAAIDKELLDGAMVRLKEHEFAYVLRRTRSGDSWHDRTLL